MIKNKNEGFAKKLQKIKKTGNDFSKIRKVVRKVPGRIVKKIQCDPESSGTGCEKNTMRP